MKIAIYSDLHLDVAAFRPPPNLNADVVILAGDIHCPGRRVLSWARRASVFGNRELVQVAGKHEFYGSTYSGERLAMREAAARLGGHFLDATSVVIEGTRFLGCTLWTDFELTFQIDWVGGCRVICNPRGYVHHSGACENEAFDPSFVVEV